jgi:hypothetical protein
MSTTNTPEPAGSLPAVARSSPDVRGFWRILLAVVAPLPGIGIAVSSAIAPYSMESDIGDVLAGAAADTGAMRIAVWFSLLATVTLIPATIAVAWVSRRRTPRLTAVAGCLTLLGFSAGLALPNDELTALTTAQEGLDHATVQALTEALWNQTTVVLPLALFLLAMVVGGILLGIALWRSRVAPRWMALALIVSGPLHVVPTGGVNAVAALGWALTAVGFAGASFALLRMNNDEFDLPPMPAASPR